MEMEVAGASSKGPSAAPGECVAACEDMMLNVLCWLPTKDLCRYRCVSRDWDGRLVPEVFSTRVSLAFLTGAAGYISFTDDGDAGDDLILTTCQPSFHQFFISRSAEPLQERKTRVLDICNGMPVLGVGFKPPRGDRLHCFPVRLISLFLLNPATGRLLTVGPAPRQLSEGLFQLAFDPITSSDQFMLVSVREGEGEGSPAVAHIYSSLEEKWRPMESCDDPPPDLSVYHQHQCYCFNGVGYKLAGFTTIAGGYFQNIIMALDLKKEHLFWITPPTVPYDGDYEYGASVTLGEAAGRLCFGVLVTKLLLSTWVLEDDGNWSHTHKLNLEVASVPPILRSVIDFYFHLLDADAILFNDRGPHIFVADLKTLRVRSITKGGDRILSPIGDDSGSGGTGDIGDGIRLGKIFPFLFRG